MEAEAEKLLFFFEWKREKASCCNGAFPALASLYI